MAGWRKAVRRGWWIIVIGSWVLVLPVSIEEGVGGWKKWFEFLDPWKANLMILYETLGPISVLIPLTVTIAGWLSFYPPRWFRGVSERLFRPTSMKGLPELERCQQALVRYMGSPVGRPINEADIAATQELRPYVYALCEVLDAQEIPHPEVDAAIVFSGTAEWGEFLARLWAVRHDIDKARLVYQIMRGG